MAEVNPSLSSSRSRSKIDLSWLASVAGLVIIFGLFTLLGRQGTEGLENFASARNIQTILRQTAIVGTAALGMTLIIISGGIDLSVGSTIALGTVVTAGCLVKGCSPLFSAGAAILVGAFCGRVNGGLITRLRVVPFIVTLGTLLVVRGAAKGLAHEQKIDAPASWLINLLAALRPEQSWMLIPVGVWLTAALAFVIACILRYTRLGRYIFAIGSNEQASRLSGVPVDRVKLMVYILASAFAGLAGVLQFSRLTVGDPTVAVGLELDVIAAVVIGGGSLSGGEGSILGSIVGALIMTVIRTGCSQMGLPNWVQEIVTGCIIVLAVALDRMRHTRGRQMA